MISELELSLIIYCAPRAFVNLFSLSVNTSGLTAGPSSVGIFIIKKSAHQILGWMRLVSPEISAAETR